LNYLKKESLWTNKSKGYLFLPVGNFTKTFCGFTSRKGVFAREEALKLRILTVQDGTVALATFVYESHDQRLSSLALSPFRTRLSY